MTGARLLKEPQSAAPYDNFRVLGAATINPKALYPTETG